MVESIKYKFYKIAKGLFLNLNMNSEVGSGTAVEIGVGAYHSNKISPYLQSKMLNDSESIQKRNHFLNIYDLINISSSLLHLYNAW